MKTIILSISIILSSALFISCSSNDDEPTPLPMEENHPIVGEWSFIYSQTSFGDPYYFEPGDIVWSFNNQNEVTISINIEITTPVMSVIQPYYVPGTYDYQINETNDSVTLWLDYLPEGESELDNIPLELNEDVLKLGSLYNAVDAGHLIVFHRN